jgi:hypothetical protein
MSRLESLDNVAGKIFDALNKGLGAGQEGAVAEIERLTSLVDIHRAENYRLGFHEPTMMENRRLRQLLTLALDYVEHQSAAPHGCEAAGSLIYSINEILRTEPGKYTGDFKALAGGDG